MAHPSHDNSPTPRPVLPAAPSTAAPPPTPRPLSPSARVRSWTEPHVRFWWLSGLAMVAVAVWFIVTQAIAWSHAARLIREGKPVQAVVFGAGGVRITNQAMVNKKYPPDTPVELQYVYEGRTHLVTMRLPEHKGLISLGGQVPIRIDPADPRNISARTTPTPLAQELVAGVVLVPLLVILAVAAVLARRRVLRTWRIGTASAAVVLDSRQTALAPRSRIVRCMLPQGRQQRPYSVYVPLRVAELHEGDMIWLILPPGRFGKPLAAAAFM